MFAAALALALVAQTPDPTSGQAARWGEHEWVNGTGFLSRHYFENRTGFPSAHHLLNSRQVGSIHHLFNATSAGSSHFWENGVRPGSRYYWDNGREPGSRYYWENGRGCLSRYGWANTTACSSGEAVVFQVLCIARKIDVAPCRAVNARLDEWLSRSDFYGSGHSADVVSRMREPNG